MRRRKISPRSALSATLLTSIVVALVALVPAVSQATGGKTRASTGHATHLRGSTALLTGAVLPAGVETSYYFEYGATSAYGSQTPTAVAGSGTAKVTVGQSISGLTPGVTYHFALVALAGGKTIVGHDKTFVAGGSPSTRLVFRLTKPHVASPYGTPILISGTLAGLGSANAPIALQASPYPYLEPFADIGAPGTTNAAGAFAFRVSNLTASTQLRVVTLGKLPVYSPVVTEQVALAVTLRVSTTKRKGFVRMYGFVTPAKAGARIELQLQKAVRPHGKSESAARYVTEATTSLKRGGRTYSRFSAVVEIRRAGRYQAVVKLGKGPLTTGTSNSIVIHDIAPTIKHRRKRR
jgi:hypothetical protein